jgi:Tfp pilus assembly protein PilO
MLKTKSNSAERLPMDSKLKKLLLYYAVSALFATVLISGAILTETYITSLSDTLNKFQTLKINSVKMKETSKNVGDTMVNVRALFPSYDKTEAMEGAILTAIDSIKSRIKGADIAIANFEKKGDEIALPVSIIGTIQDYTVFINDIGYLQSLVAPFFFINDLTISNRSDAKNAVISIEIKGIVKMQLVNIGGSS